METSGAKNDDTPRVIAMPSIPQPGYYFADNSNDNTTKVYYGAFESELECKCYKAFHSNTNEDWACVEYFSEETLDIIENDPGRATYTLLNPSQASYPVTLDVIQNYANSRISKKNLDSRYPPKLDCNLNTQNESQLMTTTAATVTKAQVLAKIDATIEAAKDARVLDIIEDFLLDYQYDTTMTDDLVFAIQEYLQDQSLKIQGGLRLLADSAKLQSVFKLVQQIKNSDSFQELIAENTPDEAVPAISAHESAKPEVVAVATTAAEVVSNKSKKGSKSPKTPKPATATKVAPKLPMPTIASISELESLDRKGLIEAVKAVKSNNPDITLRANAATVELQKTLASSLLGVDYVAPAKAPKAPKAPKTTKAKTQEIISLPEGLSWEECKGMKYRQLQQVCKALRSQGLFTGNIGGKGATTENLLKGCADYFRSQGVEIIEVELKSKSPAKDLHLPNLARARKDAELAKLATEALKLNNEDAKVMLELAVAA
jgi:hypothetical protein